MHVSRLLRLALLLPVLVVCGCGHAGQSSAPHGPYVKFTQYRLSNGLRVILAPDAASKLVSVSITYDAGSRNEKPNQAGLAHLCEHMMFEGSQHVAAREHFSLIQGVGGSANADTTADRATFYETVPANQLPLALYLEADRLNALDESADRFEQARVEVLEEKRERHDDIMYDGPVDRCQQMAFTKFAYGHAPSGTDESINSLRLDDARQFFKMYYTPSRAAISICGKFDPKQARALVSKYFGPIWSTPEAPAADCDESFARPRLAPVTMDAPTSPQGLYIRGFVTVGINDPDYAPLLLACVILGSGDVSRLERHMIERFGATSAAAYVLTHRGPSLLYFRVKYPLKLRGDDVANAVDAELEQITEHGVTADEVARARSLQAEGYLHDLEDDDGRARALSEAAICEGDPDFVNTRIDRLNRVAPADIRRVVSKYLTNDRMCEVIAEPGIGSAPAEPTQAVAPPPRATSIPAPKGVAPVAPFEVASLPPARVIDGPNGLRIVLVEDHRLPLVTMRACVAAGFVDQSQAGAATLTAHMLDQGTRTRSHDQIWDDLEKSGASLTTGTRMEYTEVKISGLSAERDQMLATLADILQSPSFSADRLANIKSELANSFIDHDETSVTLFNDLSLPLLAGGSPYVQKRTQSADIRAIRREDILSFYERCYRPNRTVIAISGDFQPDATIRSLNEDFAEWRSGETPLRPSPPTEPDKQHALCVIDWPRHSKSLFDVVCRSPREDSPDYAPFVLAAHVLSVGPSSRLHRALRDRSGETYAISTEIVNYQPWSFWECQSKTQAPRSAAYFKAMHDELAQGNPITSRELDLAKHDMLGKQAFTADDPADFAWTTALDVLRRNASDYEASSRKRLQAVTLADAQRAAKNYFAEDRLSVIAIGPQQDLKGALSPFGPVRVITRQAGH